MWEQLMQMLQKLPMQGGGMPLGGMATAGTPMGGGAVPNSPFPVSPPAQSAADVAARLSQASTGFQKGMGATPRPAPPQVATPQIAAPAPYQPNMPNASALGGGGDAMQLLMMLPGMQQILGQGAGQAQPDQMGNLPQAPGTGMPSLSQLMMMGRR